MIYGDYDVDGVCGTSVLWACLKLAGAVDVAYYIPHRVEEGYGVNPRRPPPDRDRAEGRADHHGRLRDLGDQGGEAGPRAWGRISSSPTITRSAPSCPRPTSSSTRAGREPVSVPGPLRLRGGVQARLAGLQGVRRRQEGLAAPPRLPGQVDQPGGDGDRRRRHADPRREPDPGPPRPRRRCSARPQPGLRALLSVAGCLGKKRAEHRVDRLQPRARGSTPPAGWSGRCRPSRCSRPRSTNGPRSWPRSLDLCNTEAPGGRAADGRRGPRDDHRVRAGSRGEAAIVLGREGRLAPGRDRDRGQPAGRHLPPADDRRGPRRWEHGQGSARSIAGFNLYEAIAACSGRPDNLRRPQMAAGLKVSRDELRRLRRVAFDRHCREVLSPEQLQKSIQIDAEVMLESTSRSRSLESIEATGTPRHRQPEAPAGRPTTCGSSASRGWSALKPESPAIPVLARRRESTQKADRLEHGREGQEGPDGEHPLLARLPPERSTSGTAAARSNSN